MSRVEIIDVVRGSWFDLFNTLKYDFILHIRVAYSSLGLYGFTILHITSADAIHDIVKVIIRDAYVIEEKSYTLSLLMYILFCRSLIKGI
jgi:hypothetical protein